MKNRRNIDTFINLGEFLGKQIEEEYTLDLEYEDTAEKALKTKNDNLEKLKIVLKISAKDEQINKSFFEMVQVISNRLPKDYMAMRMILSYGTVISKVDNVISLGEEELWTLSAIMKILSFDEYGYFGSILSDKQVLQAIINKAKNMDDVTEIGGQIIDLIDEQGIENKAEIIKNVLSLISSYTPEYTK